MKTVISVKTDTKTKLRAQAVAHEIGIPLSTLINAYLRELAATGRVYFALPEAMTAKTEKIIADIEKEIEDGELSGPFKTTEELFAHLDSLK